MISMHASQVRHEVLHEEQLIPASKSTVFGNIVDFNFIFFSGQNLSIIFH